MLGGASAVIKASEAPFSAIRVNNLLISTSDLD
jgi:hypothetical protein